MKTRPAQPDDIKLITAILNAERSHEGGCWHGMRAADEHWSAYLLRTLGDRIIVAFDEIGIAGVGYLRESKDAARVAIACDPSDEKRWRAAFDAIVDELRRIAGDRGHAGIEAIVRPGAHKIDAIVKERGLSQVDGKATSLSLKRGNT